MQPILIAAGGGGSSSRLGGMGHSMPPDGRGLINPWDNLNEWRKLVSKEDIDAGTLSTSMTSLLTHTVAHSTRPSFMPKANNQPLKKFLSLVVS